MSAPTDLTEPEQQLARERLAELGARFSAEGLLRDPAWRAVFESVGRHHFVPAFYPDKDGPALLCLDPARRGEWLSAVYSDTTLITKVVPQPLSRALRPATGQAWTSSSTLPSLMLTMLEALAVRDGHRVLEVGTGTGYNTALLCARLGADLVTSIDVDPELVDLAGERLAAQGQRPTLLASDGAAGHPERAPYDRIISTCAVETIPPAWLEQAAPDAVVLTDLHGPLGGTLVRLTVDEHAGARGRFLPFGTGFMAMRRHAHVETAQLRCFSHPHHTSTTGLDPSPLTAHSLLGFVVQWLVPGITRGYSTVDGEPWLYLSAVESSAEIALNAGPDYRYAVHEYGNRRLWREIEAAHAFWSDADTPSYERFGLTASPSSQHIWLDDPDHGPRWQLPEPAA